MNTNSISLSGSGRTEFPHAYVLTSKKSGLEEGSVAASSNLSLTRLQRARLAAEEATDLFFKGDKSLIGQTVNDLKGEKMTPFKKISDAKLVFVSQKVLRIAFKKLIRDMEWERLYEYLQECRRNLKENFRELYLKIVVEKEELKRFKIKDQIIN